jgi:hypothetical protein
MKLARVELAVIAIIGIQLIVYVAIIWAAIHFIRKFW